ncbi:MAG: M56 family metallopeptidase [Agathobacter sp.]|nr:M56 family metallopeptidase [Agathobacter sp.]
MMMAEFMMMLIQMSIQATFIVLVVLVIRKLFEWLRISKKYTMLLWIIPFFCLVCPWKISVPVGFWNFAPADVVTQANEKAAETGNEQSGAGSGQDNENLQNVAGSGQSNVDLQNSAGNGQNNVNLQNSAGNDGVQNNENLQNGTGSGKGNGTIQDEQNISESVNGIIQIITKRMGMIAGIVWLVGFLLLMIYSVISYVGLKKKLLCSVKVENGIFLADGITTPIVFGIIKPYIYLPTGLPAEYEKYVVAHERTHIKRGDYLWKMMLFLITGVHWFNPLVWYAFYLAGKDMEMACDEETVQTIGLEERKSYANTLLTMSGKDALKKRRIFMAPLSFDEGNTKGRIKNIMKYKKTMTFFAMVAILVVALLTMVFLSKKEEKNVSPEIEETESGEQQIKEETVLTFEMFRAAFYDQKFREMDFKSYENIEPEEEEYEGRLTDTYWFYLTYQDEVYRLQVDYEKDTDRLSYIYVYRPSDAELLLVYNEGGYVNDIDTMVNTKTTIDQWLTLELPEGYSLGEYNASLGWDGGALILPEVYEVKGEDLAPDEWKSAGFVGRTDQETANFHYVNGIPDGENCPANNHTSGEILGVLTDLDRPAVFAHQNHDLYSASQMGELWAQGITIEDETSDYWYFFFAKEDVEEIYYLSLSTRCFSKEEAIEIARTVKFTEE